LKRGPKSRWPGEVVTILSYKGPTTLKEKLIEKVKLLRAIGIKTNVSEIQRIIIEKNIDDVTRFFKADRITR